MPMILQSVGKPYPLGATCDDKGVNFALFSANATKVELCLFNQSGSQEEQRFEILQSQNNIWCTHLSTIKAGQVYGYRVYGPYKPEQGHRFNHNKLLLDPYGKKLVGTLIWHKAIFGYDMDSPNADLSFSELDSAPYVPKSVVIADAFDWENDKSPDIKIEDSIIYEAHVKGFTKLHPKVPDNYRGTFLGMSSSSVASYLKWLGVTSVELLPIHAFFGNRRRRGFAVDNYWGYESFSFFAPEQSYLVHNKISEFKQMVKSFHSRGMEVILDVVYNHTGEGNQMGPTLCYRGIDNASYYVLNSENKRYYYDSTGCGTSLNAENRYVVQMIMDSIRYWSEEMHVDGFRFDLTSSLCRKKNNFTTDCGLLYAISQDPYLQKIKMIAEPWDIGVGGYQLGAFPAGWTEWNDRYRDVVRRFWKGDKYQIAEFASRISGSSDIFNYGGRSISSSINFLTAHDGFSLNDLLSYNQKHNMANGEENRDGSNTNWSWNSGSEGESDNKQVQKNRYQRAKAMLSTLFLSFGTPMMLAGDEFLRGQMGNNNPYCQDNVLTWLVWDAINKKDMEFTRFVKKIISLRSKSKIFERKQFFTGKVNEQGIKDLIWYTEKAKEFADADWYDGERQSLSYCVYHDGSFMMAIFNANHKELRWKLPVLDNCNNWRLLLDSSGDFSSPTSLQSDTVINVPSWSVLLFEIKK